MSEAAAISLHDVSVHYRVPKGRRRSLKHLLVNLGRGGQPYEDFVALRNASLDVQFDERLGVIGQNGAGKSTLLAVISRVLKPSSGTVTVRGRIAPLLALGAGFDPELSGRENIMLNAALLGYSKRQLWQTYDDIVSWAELSDFVEAPLKTYSSGMQMRLGFSIATSSDATILLVDEVLAVGDERFRKKCHDRIADFRQRGMAIVIVSHDMKVILEQCDRVIWLRQGRIEDCGDPAQVTKNYQAFMARR